MISPGYLIFCAKVLIVKFHGGDNISHQRNDNELEIGQTRQMYEEFPNYLASGSLVQGLVH